MHICVYVRDGTCHSTMCVCAALQEESMHLLSMEVGQSGYGAATRENIEAELRSLMSEGEVPAWTTRDKVSMH